MRTTCVQERRVCGRWTRREVFGREEELGNIVLREPCGPPSLRWVVLADLRLDVGKQGINRNHSFLCIMQFKEKWKLRGWEVFLRGRPDSGRFWRRGAEFWPGGKFLNLQIFIATCIFRRGGITPSCPGGQDWEPALGGGFKQVTARGATCWFSEATVPPLHCKRHFYSLDLIEIDVKEIFAHISPTLSSSYCHNTRICQSPAELKHKKLQLFIIETNCKEQKIVCFFLQTTEITLARA